MMAVAIRLWVQGKRGCALTHPLALFGRRFYQNLSLFYWYGYQLAKLRILVELCNNIARQYLLAIAL